MGPVGITKTIVLALCASSTLVACESDEPGAGDSGHDVTTSSDADATTPSETTTPDVTPDTVAPACLPFNVTGELVANDVPGAFTLGGTRDLGLGDGRPDALVFEFYTNATGTFDLGSSLNDNYASCDQCLRVVQDIDPSGAEDPRHFFQKAGTLVVDASSPPESGRLLVEVRDLVLQEVTIFADYHTEPVKGGACYEAGASLVYQTAACVPTCGERACGPDGCGGECGAGCGQGQRCLLDGSACTSDPACYPLSLRGGELDNLAAGVYRLDTTQKALGALAESDFLQLEFYARQTGTFDLAEAPNDDYATCKQCVRLVLDGKREFFQAEGELVLDATSDPLGDPEAVPPGGALSARVTDLRLIEVTYDEETFHTEPVPNGACIDLTVDAPFERTP